MDLFGIEHGGQDEVSWVKLATDFYHHPKALAAGPTARHLYLAALAWAGQYATDGEVPAYALSSLATDAGIASDEAGAVADRLVEVRLWERSPDGWLIHDWLEWQVPAEQRRTPEMQKAAHAASSRKSAVKRRASRQIAAPRGASDLGERCQDVDVDVDVDNPPYSPPQGDGREDEFAAFYAAYPRRREPVVARRAYDAARKGGASAEALLLAAQGYAAHCRAKGTTPDLIKYPATFLNKSRWADFLPGGEGLTESEPESMMDRVRAARARSKAELEELRSQ